jgi:hypothetical protein
LLLVCIWKMASNTRFISWVAGQRASLNSEDTYCLYHFCLKIQSRPPSFNFIPPD